MVGARGAVIGHYERDHVKPPIEIDSKKADKMTASLDYLMGKIEVEMNDSIVGLNVEIQSPPDEDKSHIPYILDGLLHDA